MGVQHTPTSIKNRPKSREELSEENTALTVEVNALKADKLGLELQVTDLQLALCDVYELISAGVR